MGRKPIEKSSSWGRSIFHVRCPKLAREALVERADELLKNVGRDRWRLLFGDVLLTNEGNAHAAQRIESAPLFQAIEAQDEFIYRLASQHLAPWSETGQVPPREKLSDLALAANFHYLLGLSLGDEVPRLNRILASLMRSARPGWLSLAERFEILSPRDWIRFFVARGRWNRTLQSLIAKPGSPSLPTEKLARLKFPRGGHRESIGRELNALLAGYDTTARVLESSLGYALSEKSLKEHLADEAQRAGFDYLQLTLTRGIVDEALRLHPPVKTIRRFAANDLTLGGLAIRRGDILLIDCEAIHRDPSLHHHPAESTPALTYFPFGAGRHRCPGEAMARRQLALSLAAYFQKPLSRK